ncbi:MAG: ribonuclease H-like domain-containing protein [Lachnospiraceae bacterium]|nr:ribonuclease H-like domain-containing protein [Lachnospiraceae bacterium]
MKTIITDFDDFSPSYPIESIAPLDDILFVDIETTGLSPRSSNLYIIGAVYHAEGTWHAIQWLADKYEEECLILEAFLTFVKSYKVLIHFNGNRFDIPFLQAKCETFDLEDSFKNLEGIDLYKRIVSYKNILGLLDCKQKTIEQFLGIYREDTFSGRELISYYHDYVISGSEESYKLFMLHNLEDLKGMLPLLSILSYTDLFTKAPKVMGAKASYYLNSDKTRCQEIILKLRLEAALPRPISFHAMGCYFSGEGVDASLKIPLYEEEMKFFYSGYKNYYYLPAEDMAMHKSVATYVDKEHRVQATASNCYTRKQSFYLPQWEPLFTPFFKRDYASKEIFFELSDEFKKNRSGFSMYAAHILQVMSRNA